VPRFLDVVREAIARRNARDAAGRRAAGGS